MSGRLPRTAGPRAGRSLAFSGQAPDRGCDDDIYRDQIRARRIGPANARTAELVPFDLLLPHTDVLVSNTGYGGVQPFSTRGSR
ncbi:MAG: glycosyl transferase, UDP-glucuronosyltransferase [Streptomyces oryziradicis]|nr:glycosyl transferase, UDP-glucuronosyltransferase [Actinacidiphila oryziradicis]